MAATGLAVAAVVLVAPVVARGLGERPFFYGASLRIAEGHLLTGVGFGAVDDHFLIERAVAHAQQYGVSFTNTAHSVPLEFLVAAGVIAAVAYLTFVGYVGWLGIRGVIAGEGPDWGVLVPLVAVWVAYQAQSFISVDVPALAALHWIIAAGVVLQAQRVLLGPGSKPSQRRDHKRRPGGPSVVERALAGTVVVVAAALVVVATRPLRADIAARNGVDTFAQDLPGALASLDRAHELAPWEGMYWFLEASVLERIGELEPALRALIRAAELEPGAVRYALAAAQMADATGSQELAADWYIEATRRDPLYTQTLLSAASYLDQIGDSGRARDLYERVLQLDPNNTQAQEAMN